MNKITSRFNKSFFAFWLIFALLLTCAPSAILAQTAAPIKTASADAAQLEKIAEKFEKRRVELGIPGASLVIVKDDKIIFLKGFGYKDLANKIAVTPDTQFAIGSATKAFTGLSVMMSQDAGKLKLDDSPKKHLSYFKINNPETDKAITIRDLLSHSSGVNRTDLAMVSGKLNREELIRVVGEAKPVAKLREQFLYQNIMFAAAGEIVAKTNQTTWEKYVAERIFKPLNMTNSNLTVADMEKAADYSFGYTYNSDTKTATRVPFRDIGETAPAGSINSSARDMANWLRFMLGSGEFGGKRIVSADAFAELTKPQMKMSPNGKMSYGLGWFLQEWQGKKVVQHGGNIDGFNSLVGFMPETKTGFAILTNVSNSSLPPEMMNAIWEDMFAKPAEKIAVDPNYKPESEIGKYRIEAANLDIDITMQNGKLTALVPGQPNYVLENVGGRKYKLTGAPDGFFITFRDEDASLEQPQGNVVLSKVKTGTGGVSPAKINNSAAKELIGVYESDAARGGIYAKISERDGKIMIELPGNQNYEILDKSVETFSLSPLPDVYFLKLRRDTANKISTVIIVQPEGEFSFRRQNETTKTDVKLPTVDELMPKVIAALGGEANWRKLNSRITKIDVDFIHQGVKGSGTSYAKAPNLIANELTFTALNKKIGESFDYFDGTNGAQLLSFSPEEKFTGKQLEDARIGADFYGLLNWKKNYKTATVKNIAKVGDEEAFVVTFEPEKGNKDTIYFSTKTFLPIKSESVISIPTSGIDLPVVEKFSDYRKVDGVMIAFVTVNSNIGNGDLVLTIKEIKHNVKIDAKKFAAPR